jgi:hypothetical protein
MTPFLASVKTNYSYEDAIAQTNYIYSVVLEIGITRLMWVIVARICGCTIVKLLPI